MGSPGGYQINPGLYRVPDLLTEEQFKDYMWNTYGRRVSFTDDVEVSPARALGQTHPVGPLDEVDEGRMSPNAVNDPVLRHLNNMNFGPNYASTPGGPENDELPADSVQDEPALNTNAPNVSTDPDSPPTAIDESGHPVDKDERQSQVRAAETESEPKEADRPLEEVNEELSSETKSDAIKSDKIHRPASNKSTKK